MRTVLLAAILGICLSWNFCDSKSIAAKSIAENEKEFLQIKDTEVVRQDGCKDKDKKWCKTYVETYANSHYKICEQDWFISDAGRYGCKKSCNLCNDVGHATLKPGTCEDKDAKFCSTYVGFYGDQVCKADWFFSADGRYGCKKSCNLC